MVQLLADDDTPRNIARAGELVQAAVLSGAQLVVLPEKWNWWGPAARTAEGAEGLDGRSLTAARAWARELGVALVAGSILEAIGGGSRAYNTSVAIAPDGRDVAIYRKVHLFDVTVEGREYRESATVEPGEALATAALAGLRVGLSVCYDLRFPELYRHLVASGATALAVPANFTVPTGESHWEVLLRARAIETQTFVVAAAQTGTYFEGNDERASWGHSMIMNPWGHMIAQAAEGAGHTSADIDMDYLKDVRARIPVANHRVLRALEQGKRL